MKLRLTLLVLSLALLIAPAAGFAEPLASTAPAACAAQAATLASILDPVTLEILPKSFPPLPKCGACSGSPCVGANVASICGVGGGGQYKYCADIANCPQDGLTQCMCKTGAPF